MIDISNVMKGGDIRGGGGGSVVRIIKNIYLAVAGGAIEGGAGVIRHDVIRRKVQEGGRRSGIIFQIFNRVNCTTKCCGTNSFQA